MCGPIAPLAGVSHADIQNMLPYAVTVTSECMSCVKLAREGRRKGDESGPPKKVKDTDLRARESGKPRVTSSSLLTLLVKQTQSG